MSKKRTKMDQKKFVAIVLTLVFVIGAGLVAFISSEHKTAERSAGGPTTDIIFMSNTYSHQVDQANIFKKLGLWDWDLAVLGGDHVANSNKNSQEALKNFQKSGEKLSKETFFITGENEADIKKPENQKPYGSMTINNTQNIYLDTVGSEKGMSCGFDEEQLEFLRTSLDEVGPSVRIIYLHHAWWADKTYIDSAKPNTTQPKCLDGYWESNIEPIIAGKVQLVISGDGGQRQTFSVAERAGVKYILSGTKAFDTYDPAKDTKSVSFTRVQVVGEEIAYDDIIFANEKLIDNNAISDIAEYRVTVDQSELEALYDNAPFYPLNTDWQLKIEPEDVLLAIQKPLIGTVDLGGQDVNIEFSNRGNVGNHWDSFKKSWDIDFTDTDNRQLKFVIPSDRGYINQMYVQKLNDWLGVPTSEITIAKLVINDINFGTYLVYEDFDKAFIELNDFNSNAAPSKNFFRDHFDAYKITDDLNYTTGTKEDKSDQQNLSAGAFSKDNFVDYFDQDNYARWLAMQIFTGDAHQNLSDNFRYFLDKATGRYIMVTWDESLAAIKKDMVIPEYLPQQTFYKDEANRQLVLSYVTKLLDNSPELRAELVAMQAKYKPIFTNDAALESPERSIEGGINNLLKTFDDNVAFLREWVNAGGNQ